MRVSLFLWAFFPITLSGYSPADLQRFQNNLPYMGNRKHQIVPSIRTDPVPKASTKLSVTPGLFGKGMCMCPCSSESAMNAPESSPPSTKAPDTPSPPMNVPVVPVVVPEGGYTTHPPWPKKILGLYILLADDTEDGFGSDSTGWTPELFPWQQEAANVLFFTFIHPGTMAIPPSYRTLAASRGSGQPGSVPRDTVIMFAIGGYAYSLKPNPWHWLTSKDAAVQMAAEVATWPEKYGCDGIDLDLEEGAGAKGEAGPNMIHFIRKIREIRKAAGLPRMIISQPCYGYPQVQAESDVINESWDKKQNSQDLADSIGLMVYNGHDSLNYVVKYNDGPGLTEWGAWFPIKVSVPKNAILLGAQGNTDPSSISKLASEAVSQDLLGIMVWYSSVKNGFQYKPSGPWDASDSEGSIQAYKNAMAMFKSHNG